MDPLNTRFITKLNWFNSSINRRNYEIFKCNYQASTDTKTEEKNMQNASAARRGKKSFVKSTSFRSRCAENEKYHMKLTPPRAGKPPQPP